MFINYLPDVTEVLIKLFADDAKIYAVVSNQADNNKVQSSLNRAVNWADIWKMLFKIIKCHHLHVGKHDRETKYIGDITRVVISYEIYQTSLRRV